MVPGSSLVWQKREILALSEEFKQDNNVMDKICDRNPSKYEVNGRCGGDEKTKDHAEPTKVERKK